ncbi:hypothetical protein QEN19_000613 [Hanseniaspora menglaensis]
MSENTSNQDDTLQFREDGSLILEAVPSFSQINETLRSRKDSVSFQPRHRGSSVASSILDTIEHITLNNEHTDVNTKDPGLRNEEYYKKKMSNRRFKTRQIFLKFVQIETEKLVYIQKTFRSFILDEYFIYSANLGSHFFYVLCLPMTRWIPISNSVDYSRDLIYVLAFSIYFSGCIKDYLCLPRPKTPSIIRITHSEYTTKEYGAPSSHTANATAVTAYVVIKLLQNIKEFSLKECILYFGLISMYYITLTFGRLYAGMHGFFDLQSGAVIGLLTLVMRLASKQIVDYHWMLNGSVLYPVLHVIFGFIVLLWHTHPAELCPCFEDSVAFIGVVGGLEISDWLCCNMGEKWFPWVQKIQEQRLYFQLPFPAGRDDYLNIVVARLAIGVVLVMLWKEVITVAITKNVFKLKTTSILSQKTLKQQRVLDYEPFPFKVIVLRYWIYAGIAIVACTISPMVFGTCGLV